MNGINAKLIKQIQDDYREILSTKAGMRVLGGIFHIGRLNGVGLHTDYTQGKRDLAVDIANTIYEVNPYGIIDCMKAYDDLMKEYPDDERRDDAEPYEFTE